MWFKIDDAPQAVAAQAAAQGAGRVDRHSCRNGPPVERPCPPAACGRGHGRSAAQEIGAKFFQGNELQFHSTGTRQTCQSLLVSIRVGRRPLNLRFCRSPKVPIRGRCSPNLPMVDPNFDFPDLIDSGLPSPARLCENTSSFLEDFAWPAPREAIRALFALASPSRAGISPQSRPMEAGYGYRHLDYHETAGNFERVAARPLPPPDRSPARTRRPHPPLALEPEPEGRAPRRSSPTSRPWSSTS